eukprot:9779431-Alexandrium_andersonii.AAC.1
MRWRSAAEPQRKRVVLRCPPTPCACAVGASPAAMPLFLADPEGDGEVCAVPLRKLSPQRPGAYARLRCRPAL